MFTQIQPAARLQLLSPPVPPYSPLRRRRPPLFRCHPSCASSRRLRVFSCTTGEKNSTRRAESGDFSEEDEVRRAYPFHEIEPKWQRYWEETKTFRTPDEIDTSKPKFYVLDMFPYPRYILSHFLDSCLLRLGWILWYRHVYWILDLLVFVNSLFLNVFPANNWILDFFLTYTLPKLL